MLYGKLDIRGFSAEVNNLEKALSEGNAEELVRMYDKLLMTILCDIYVREDRKYAEFNAGEEVTLIGIGVDRVSRRIRASKIEKR
jgi:hypothetical protein